MLKGVPSVLSPEMLKVLAEMGHGDEIVIGDMHYPAASTAKNILLRADGIGSVQLIEAILHIMTLDHAVEKPFLIMQKQECDAHLELPVHEEYFNVVAKYDSRGRDAVGYIDRFDFYDRAAKAYAVVATGELSFYGCTILKKGCVPLDEVI
jgi:L-fucose mutarotase